MTLDGITEHVRLAYWTWLTQSHAGTKSRVAALGDFLGIPVAWLSVALLGCVLGLILALALREIRLERPQRGFVLMCVMIGTACLLTGGFHDSPFHVARVAHLAASLRHGELEPFFHNTVQDESLPVFVFYSVLPYVPAVLLALAGLPAETAYGLSLVLNFLVFAVGVAALTRQHVNLAGLPTREVTSAWYCAILLTASATVAGNWVVRSALAEASVVALAPWALFALRSGSRWAFALFLTVQLAAHPIVTPQAIGAVLVLHYCLDGPPLRLALARLGPPILLAFLASSVFWLPQALWKHTIGGPEGTGRVFTDSFHSVFSLLDPFMFNTVGLWLLLAVGIAATALLRQGGLHRHLLLGAFLLSLLAQIEWLSPLVAEIPVLNMGQFVWRLMPASALLGFGVLLAGLNALPQRWLKLLCLASCANLLVVIAVNSNQHVNLLFSRLDDERYLLLYMTHVHAGGSEEFRPDYSRLAQICGSLPEGSVQAESYRAARAALSVTAPFLALRRAPHEFVTYRANGEVVQPAGHCADSLVLGPFAAPTTVTADETLVAGITLARLLLALALCGAAGVLILGIAGSAIRAMRHA